MARTEILLSGSGGQGLILAGIILAEAAVVHDGVNAIHNQSYGPEARGGACKSEVIISDEEIHFPEVGSPDILLAMTQLAADKYAVDQRRRSSYCRSCICQDNSGDQSGPCNECR